MIAQRKLKPMVRARRAPAFSSRAGHPTISRLFEEYLFRYAEVLSEGGCRSVKGHADSYFGSCMITVDLDQLRPWFRSELDTAARSLLADAIDGSVRVRLRAMRLARAEAMRRTPDRTLGTLHVETRIRLTERQLHIDVDLEAALSVLSGAGAP